jgi:8-oxo-dGTP diphosphatase
MKRPQVGVGVILHDQGRVLLGLRQNSHGTGTWCFPGGHLEFGESILECAQRELTEETGLTSSSLVCGPVTNDIFESEEKHYITLFVLAKYSGGEVQLCEPEKCLEWRWYNWSELPSPLFLPIQNLIGQGFQLEDV